MNFLSDFGVQPVLLAAQVVNFFVLLFILKKFLYKPILKVLEKRKETIAQSLKNAQQIEKRLNEISEEEQKRIMKAAVEGEKIIKQAQESGVAIIEDAKLKASEVAEKIAQDSRKQIEVDRQKMNQEIRTELADLVAVGLKVVTGKVLSEKDKKEITEKSLKGLS